ncbi:hypothetical protein PAXRUDRAFT_170532 [Paxillus rubicundulus Ve08.2h10]|uniref:Uncharacterized protein n=1 Tax=Paxillus rubicundulus Ve08.2h10 TaxID=930991 RepID=A0A0D0D7I0_9AGAM|nr:hypothetical protein PAXRUDRAFT_170532 [Paxillus rubicundulus Ve08.2h10]
MCCNITTEDTIIAIQDSLNCFHKYCKVFHAEEVISMFSLPRQHSMTHYIHLIHLFGAPNGLCSSITECKHIKAVKEPYHCMNHHNALRQMLIINQRLNKLAAARVDFQKQGMLNGTCPSTTLEALGK